MPPGELAGKYKKPFEELKQQLKDELTEYLKVLILGDVKILGDDEGRQAIAEINQAWQQAEVGRQIGRAAFREFDVKKVEQLAQEHRRRVWGIYQAYLDRHTCLYAAGPSWDPGNPQPPLIYNDVVDKFYDEAAGGWIDKEKPPGAAILIFVSDKTATGQKEAGHEG